MRRSMLAVAFCGLVFMAGFFLGAGDVSRLARTEPGAAGTLPATGNPPVYQPNAAAGNSYPAVQPNKVPSGQYPAMQPGNTTDNRYPPAGQPTGQPATAPAGAADNRYPPQMQPGRPDQPLYPQIPTVIRRPQQQQQSQQPQASTAVPPPPSYQLTPAEQAKVDDVLKTWEQKSRNVKTFDSKFVRFEYDLTFPVVDPKAPPGSQPLPNNKDQGFLKYAMPDKGVYRILYSDTQLNGNWQPTPPQRIQHWLCDGNSVYEYIYPTDPNDPKRTGQVVEHPLPPEMKGKAIADGPLPFLFGADAEKLRKRYYFKVIPPPDPQKAEKEIWLDAYPKFQQDAANFSCAQLVLNKSDMTPTALRLYLPGGKNYSSYVFFDTVINDKLRLFTGNPFQPYTPRGWQKVTEPLPAQNGQPLPPAKVGRAMGQLR